MDTERMRAMLGPRADFYLPRFEKIERDGGGWVPGWNFPAFFCSTAWFTYRRMDGWATANFFLLIGGALATVLAQSLLVFAVFLAVAFVLIPVYADAIYFRHLTARLAKAEAAGDGRAAARLRRPPSAWTLVAAVLSNALAFFVPTVFIVAPAAYADYAPRARIAEGLGFARALSNEVSAFHAEHRRLPGPQEAADFRIKVPIKHVDSVAYDPERKMIVVTMRHGYRDGKRFAMRATEKDGALSWTCRTVDVEPKYLPASCRD